MGYYEYLCRLLAPLRIYKLERESISGAELSAAGLGLDEAAQAVSRAEQEGILMLAEGEGLSEREKLFARCPLRESVALRRQAIAALSAIGPGDFTLGAINRALSGCGIAARVRETEEQGVVEVSFPFTAGEPEGFSQVESIILDIIPCHLLTRFVFRYLTWEECEAQGFTWQSVEDAQHSWESFEKAVVLA